MFTKFSNIVFSVAFLRIFCFKTRVLKVIVFTTMLARWFILGLFDFLMNIIDLLH